MTKSSKNCTARFQELTLNQRKMYFFLIKIGCSQIAHQPDERINVQFPENIEKIVRKEWVLSLKKNKEDPIRYWANSSKT